MDFLENETEKEVKTKERKRSNKNDVDLSHPSTWKNRRKMAWISLICMIFLTIALLIAPEDYIRDKRIEILSDVLTWVYLGFVSVIGAYMGFTTYASIKGRRSKDDDNYI